MISKGTELLTFIDSLNADADIDAGLADVLVDNARTILEAERPWAVLRKTDISLSASPVDTWQTAKSLAGIADFGRFYGENPVRLFDGDNRIAYYQQVPFEDRLENKDNSGTFVLDAGESAIYLNGRASFGGSLYLNYLKDSGAIDLTLDARVWAPFPSRFLPILGYYAIGIFKGAVDYDSINREMLPSNQAALSALKNAMENWDNELQLSSIEGTDPSERMNGYRRTGAVVGDD